MHTYEEITRKQRVINKENKRRLVRSATMHCKFTTTNEYIDETSKVQHNKILGLEFSFLLLLLLHSLWLKPYWSIQGLL